MCCFLIGPSQPPRTENLRKIKIKSSQIPTSQSNDKEVGLNCCNNGVRGRDILVTWPDQGKGLKLCQRDDLQILSDLGITESSLVRIELRNLGKKQIPAVSQVGGRTHDIELTDTNPD